MMSFRSSLTCARFMGTLGVLVGVSQLCATPIKLDYKNPLTLLGAQLPGSHVPLVNYNVGAIPWVVTLQPDPPVYLPPAATAQSNLDAFDAETLLSNIMSTSYPKWSVAESPNSLSDGSLDVHIYEAVHEAKGASLFCKNACVGANFGVNYVPGKGDHPTDVHWVQVVTLDGKVSVDVKDNKQGSPYYDDNGAADATYFYDEPRSSDWVAHTKLFDLFLVQGPALPADGSAAIPGQITVLGGIQWGYENHCIKPKDQSSSGFSPADACGCGCGDPTPTPEPSTLLTSVGSVGLLGVILMRSRRQRQQRDLIVNGSSLLGSKDGAGRGSAPFEPGFQGAGNDSPGNGPFLSSRR
jgi:hypothetical protein